MIVAQWNQNLRQMALPVVTGALLPAAAAWAGGLSLPAAAGVGGLGLCSALIFCRLWRRDRRIFQADSEMLEMVSAIFPGIWYECRIYPDGSRVFLRVSQNISDLLGIDPERLKRAPLQLVDWLHPEDRERILNGIVEHSRTLEPWRQEYRLVRPDGKTLWVKSRAQISREADGSALWRGVIFDRTAHREAAEAIRKSEERLAMATRAGKVAIWDYDLTTQHISWNDVAYELHGVDPLTYQPTPANNAQFVHPDERDWVYRKFERSLADGSRDYEAECRIVRPDGEVRHTRSAAVILRDGNGKPYRVIGTEIDVTEPKRLEADLIRARDQAEAATRTKNEFLAMMSHEIRTPLNGVLGFAGLLRDSPLTEQQSDYVSTIESSAESLLLLVGDILDLSRIEANQLKIAPAFFELRPCLQEVAALLHPRAEQKGLAWEMEVPPEAPRFIMLDRLRFVQILTNLIGNAIKFTESGSIRLRVEATPEPAGASQWKWRFAVQDTGRGLSPEVQQSLFTPDFRAIPPEHRSPGGTGLGLAICRRLAQLLGGVITCDSAPPAGATFAFGVTTETSAEAPAVESAEAAAAFPAPLSGKRILIVEDHPINLRLCEIHLRRLGCRSEAAVTGPEALARWRSGGFDAILMDVQLPELDGCMVTRAIREAEPPGRRVPIIAMTANAMPGDRQLCLEAGMDDYLTKPIRIDLLAETLARWLRPEK